MEHIEKKLARSFDTPGRCRKFTDLVYSGVNPNPPELAKKIFSIENEFYPPEPEYLLYFGEMHGHTNLSDGQTDIDDYFTNIRDGAELDFAALTDHDHGGIGHAELWGDGKWNLIRRKVKEYYQPGKFTTILAYERDSYPWYNNLVVYYDNHEGELLRGEHDGEITKQELAAWLKRPDLLLVPHDTYMLSAGCDFNSIPPELMPPLLEIISRGDCAEYFDHPLFREHDTWCRGGSWQDALRNGGRIGVIAGSDDHLGHNGMTVDETDPRCPHHYTGIAKYPGITGVWAEKNTLPSIFKALKARRCYGFTGGRMKLDFRINGHYMGEEFSLSRGETRMIWFDFSADSPVDRVTLVKNERDYMIFRNCGRQLFFDYRAERECDCYYIRGITADGRWCWSSPIWIHSAED
ncbi:MAG: DUF3604 domain-containing protein [Lentisphaeria bacterium]|nr:DUF3604 domain-containing protein [Lentisphaeria bacterium]